MSDPVTVSARATADRLAAEYGLGLAADVEAALHTCGSSRQPEQYIDPVSLGSLIVSIATLAWTVYSDLIKKTPDVQPDAVARTVRVSLRKRGEAVTEEEDKITDVVVTEVIRAANGPE